MKKEDAWYWFIMGIKSVEINTSVSTFKKLFNEVQNNDMNDNEFDLLWNNMKFEEKMVIEK